MNPLRRIDRWLSDYVPWSPNFSIALAVLIALMILLGAPPVSGLLSLAACLYLAFR